MITSNDIQTITDQTLTRTAKLLEDLRQLRQDCTFPPSALMMIDAIPPASLVDADISVEGEITEKRVALPPSLPWLAQLDRAVGQETRYSHPIRNGSLIDMLECGIIAHNRIPEKILLLSRYNSLILAILGHDGVYHRSTGDIPLLMGEDLDENSDIIVLIGSAASARNLVDQPTVEIPKVEIAITAIEVAQRPAA